MEDSTIELSGECTIYRASEIRETLVHALGGNSCSVDLSHITAIDTCILQLLIAAKKDALNQGKILTLKNHSDEVLRMIDFYGLIGFFGDALRVPAALKKELSLSYGMH